LNRLLFRFGTAHKEHEKFIYNETGFLLSMALADGALFGVESVDDLQKKEIPPGENELILRYHESFLKKPILRKCTKAGGVMDEPMPKSAFLGIWWSNASNAGYFHAPTIHAIQRGLGKKVDSEYCPNSSRLIILITFPLCTAPPSPLFLPRRLPLTTRGRSAVRGYTAFRLSAVYTRR
jgi:Protein of unknown function (DUF3435)